jgi:hypothetical protein
MAFQLLAIDAVMAFPESLFLCSLCNDPVDLRTAKTDEYGKAIHEKCYLLQMQMKREMLVLGESVESGQTGN